MPAQNTLTQNTLAQNALAQNTGTLAQASNAWLKSYYFARFAVSALWVALAFTVARTMPPLAAIMLVAYPAWDALANFIDAQRTGGMSRNKSQLLNFVISALTTLAVAVALTSSMN